MVGRDIGNGAPMKLYILTKCGVIGMILEWVMKIFERCYPKRLALIKVVFNGFHNALSYMFKVLNFVSKRSFT